MRLEKDHTAVMNRFHHFTQLNRFCGWKPPKLLRVFKSIVVENFDKRYTDVGPLAFLTASIIPKI